MAVLLDSGMSVQHVAVLMATAVEAIDIAVRYLNETERTTVPSMTDSIMWLHSL